MVSPERRACSRAAASDFSDGSMPVTVAPSAASVSARMPPPHPTSKTPLPPNPPNTRRKYSTRTAFSSCSPANGPASLHHTPGTRSTRRSYFSGSERPPRRGSWSLMTGNVRRNEQDGASRWRMVKDGVGGYRARAGWCHASQRTSNRAGIRTNFVLAGSSRRSHPPPSSTIILHQAPPTSPNLPNLPQPPSGSRLDVGERRHVEKPQPREPRVLVHLDEQQVGDTHDGGGALASYADVEHRL